MKVRERAQLFLQLALMEQSGLPAAEALGTLRVPGAFRMPLSQMQRLVAKGVDVASAGERTGVFTPFETELVRAAIHAGSPAPTYTHLADDYERRAAHLSNVRGKLALPLGLFALALFLQPLPDLALSRIGKWGYAARALLPLAGTIAVLWSLVTPRLATVRATLAARFPLFGPAHERRNLRELFGSLALLLEAGVPAGAAFPLALNAVPDRTIANRFDEVAVRLARGSSLTAALGEIAFTDRGTAIGFIRTGEASGTLAASLDTVAARYADAVNRFDTAAATWLPRLFYFGVAIWMAMRLVGNTLALPGVPSDL